MDREQDLRKLPRHLVRGVVLLCVLPLLPLGLGLPDGSATPPFGITFPGPFAAHSGYLLDRFSQTLEINILLTGLFSFLLAVACYRRTGNPLTPLLGLVLLFAATVDCLHFNPLSPTQADSSEIKNALVVVATGFRITTTLILICGVAWLLARQSVAFKRDMLVFSLAGIGVIVASYAAIHDPFPHHEIPDVVFPTKFVSRPWDLLPFFLLVLAAVDLFPLLHEKLPGPFSHSVAIGMIPQCTSQLYVAFGSTGPFDSAQSLAYLLRWLAYLIILVGAGLEYVSRHYEDIISTDRQFLDAVLLRLQALLLGRRHPGGPGPMGRVEAEFEETDDDPKADDADDRAANGGHEGGTATASPREPSNHPLSLEAEMLRTTFERAPIAIGITDESMRLREVNPALLALIGHSRQELLDRPYAEIVHPDDRAAVAENLDRLTRGQVDQFQTIRRFLHKDGHTVVMDLSVTARRDGQGRLRGLVGVGTDVTKRRQNEQELRRAKETAEAASRAQSAFLANMSHEIRTPLNAVIGVTQLLLADDPGTEQQRLLLMIQDSGQALLRIVNDILDVAKIQAGRLALEPIPFDLHEVVNGATSMQGILARAKGLSFEVRLHPCVPRLVIGDPGRIRQVLLNLVNNAVKFTEEGQVLIEVTCLRREQGIAQIRFSVTDTGIGIAPELTPHLFESFTQADVSTTRKYGGTGLGLALCRQLVELMGGELGVDSEPERGSNFWVILTLPHAPALENRELSDLMLKNLDGISSAGVSPPAAGSHR